MTGVANPWEPTEPANANSRYGAGSSLSLLDRRLQTSAGAKGALDGIVVADLTHALAGPYCTMMLGDMGAEVVKVEAPGAGDEARGWGPPFLGSESSYFLSINRNKKSITVNLKQEDGKAILWRLVRKADVLVENFTAGTMDRLGFSWEKVHEANPRLVYCSISGFGQTGPEHLRPAYDAVVQGMAGMMSITGQENGDPTKFGVPIADIVAGMFGAFAIACAVNYQKESGEGQFIDTSMLGGQVAILVYQAARFFATNEVPGLSGSHHTIIAPYGTFRTRTGHVNIAVGNERLWGRFCAALDLEHLSTDPRFASNADRVRHRSQLVPIIEEQLQRWSSAEVIERLEAAEVPCGPINNLAQVFEEPQVRHLGLVEHQVHPTAGEIAQVGMPYRLSATPGGIELPPPTLGQHTAEVLRSLGFANGEIEAFHRNGAI